MNTEMKNMWRKKSWSNPDLLGSKNEYTKIVIGLIQQIASDNAKVWMIFLYWKASPGPEHGENMFLF